VCFVFFNLKLFEVLTIMWDQEVQGQARLHVGSLFEPPASIVSSTDLRLPSIFVANSSGLRIDCWELHCHTPTCLIHPRQGYAVHDSDRGLKEWKTCSSVCEHGVSEERIATERG
jgi:hypothetical protein